jgi:predicted transcriptional regulator
VSATPIRLSAATRKKADEAAEAAGLSVHDYVRQAIDEKAARDGPPAKLKRGEKECAKARFHRPGAFCKSCGRSF